MIKTAFAAAAAAVAFAAPGAALAGPYVNVEANSGFTGNWILFFKVAYSEADFVDTQNCCS